MRYFISLAYKGTEFHGWQVQPNAISIQEKINDALSILLKQEIRVVGAGRTDTGVHAKQMYAHFNTDIDIKCKEITFRLNSYLSDAIHIKSIFLVSDSTHARFDAISRVYEYWLCEDKNPFLIDSAWFLYGSLNFELMNEAAGHLLQVNDFTSFAKVHTDVKTHICDVRKAFWKKMEDKWVFQIEADRYLRNMVRAIVGTLVDVGKGKLTVQQFRDIIEKKNRCAAGISAPAKGLYLVKINYPEDLINAK